MADSFSKKENYKKKVLKQKVKDQKKLDRKTHNNKGKGFESMIAYVDENGQLTSTPPEPKKPAEKDATSARPHTPIAAAKTTGTNIAVR